MQIETIDGSFAREVHGLQLWQPVDGADAEALREAFREAGVLVIRRQSLSEEELLVFGKMIG